jgi:NodT family efflux transporter outer membrane factor (OMF) lipoprotein
MNHLRVRPFVGVLAGAGVGLLAACATPPRHEPSAPQPLTSDAIGLTGQAGTPASDQWWSSFDDAQLGRLIQDALASNPSLGEAAGRVRAAQALALSARSAQFPGLRLSGGESRLKIPSGFPPAIDGGSTVWAGDLGPVLSWDLDLWGKHAASYQQAQSLSAAAVLDVEQTRLLLEGALVQAYIDLYRAYAHAQIADQAQSQRTHILDITRQRVSAGLDTHVELREAEGALPQARLQVLQAQAAQALAVHRLVALTGHGVDRYASIERPQLNLDAALPLPNELPLNLLARRPDIIAARARIDAADAGKRASKAAFYPDVSLRALAGFASFSLDDLIGASSFGYSVGPSVSLPLFDAGRLRAAYRSSEAQLDEAVASYDDTVVQAVQQSSDQLSLIDSLQQQIEQQQQSLSAAEEAYRLAEERYRAGLAGYLTVLNAETEVLSQRQQHVDLTSSLVLARVTLLLTLGGSFDPSADAPAGARQAQALPIEGPMP